MSGDQGHGRAGAPARAVAGLGAAALAASAVSLLVAVVMANLLGPDDYADYAALLSAFLVLSIPGTAMQASVARDVAGAGARAEAIAAHVRHLSRLAAGGGLVLAAAILVAREPFADLVGTPTEPVAAALTAATALAWVTVSLQRGALQGLGRPVLVGATMVAEAAGRLALGVALVLAGLGVAGAVGGYVATLVALGAVLDVRLPHGRGGAEPLRALLRGAATPGAMALLLAAVQNLDILIVQHVSPGTPAGRYAVASLAAKSIVWLAVGLGLHLLPETSRRAARGADPRPLLLRCLAYTAGAAALMLAVFAAAGPTLVELVFGDEYVVSTGLLVTLGAAMSCLAASTLMAQYLLAVRRTAFLAPLLAAAVAVVAAMVLAGPGLTDMALALLVVQVLLAAALAGLAVRARPNTLRPR